MDQPHIASVPLPLYEKDNYRPNDSKTWNISKKTNTNANAMAPSSCNKLNVPYRMIQPNKLQNFTNEYDKDISKLYNDPCLNPNYSRLYNWKDRKFRGNQFGVRYDWNKIWGRSKYYQKYDVKDINKELPFVIKPSPWYNFNDGQPQTILKQNGDIDIINNRQDVYNVNYQSYPYYYYKYTNATPESKWLEKPFVQLPYFVENFGINNVNSIINLIVLVVVIILLIRYLYPYLKKILI